MSVIWRKKRRQLWASGTTPRNIGTFHSSSVFPLSGEIKGDPCCQPRSYCIGRQSCCHSLWLPWSHLSFPWRSFPVALIHQVEVILEAFSPTKLSHLHPESFLLHVLGVAAILPEFLLGIFSLPCFLRKGLYELALRHIFHSSPSGIISIRNNTNFIACHWYTSAISDAETDFFLKFTFF